MSNVTCFEDLTNVPDSMLLDSGTDIAVYHNLDTNIHFSLEVRGYVTLDYKGTRYTTPSEFPEELKQMFRDGSYADNPDVSILENNWFELFEMDENNDFTGWSEVVDCENCSPAALEELFKDWEETLLEDRETEKDM